jgi:hypothetical protein
MGTGCSRLFPKIPGYFPLTSFCHKSISFEFKILKVKIL